MQIEWSVGIVVRFGRVAMFGQLAPEDVETRPVPEGDWHLREHLDSDRRAGVDAVEPIVDAELDFGVVRKVDYQAVADELPELGLFALGKLPLANKLGKYPHVATAALGSVIFEEGQD